MRLGRVFCFLILFGLSAIAAYAQTPVAPSTVIPDPKVLFSTPDPPCPTGEYCVDLIYNGTTPLTVDFMELEVATPPGELPNPLSYSCGGNVFAACSIVDNSPTPPPTPTELFGFFFYTPEGDTAPIFSPGETFSVTSTAPITLLLPDVPFVTCDPPSSCPLVNGAPQIDLSPEPGTALLFMSGLISVIGFARKRFGARLDS
jgi:hypothetical protein